MVEDLISGLYLVGDVALLGLLVYNSHKPHNKIKRGSSDIYESSRACGNNFTAYKDLKGRGRDRRLTEVS